MEWSVGSLRMKEPEIVKSATKFCGALVHASDTKAPHFCCNRQMRRSSKTTASDY